MSAAQVHVATVMLEATTQGICFRVKHRPVKYFHSSRLLWLYVKVNKTMGYENKSISLNSPLRQRPHVVIVVLSFLMLTELTWLVIKTK